MRYMNMDLKVNNVVSCFREIFLVSLLLMLSACASSDYRAPVQNAEPSSDVPSGQVDGPIGTLEGRPLQPGQSVQGEAIAPNQAPPPVVGNLLRQSEQAGAQQQWAKAETYLQRALRISPKNALLWSRMAETKLQQGKKSQALQFASKSNAITKDVILKQRNAEIINAARQ